uniref:Sweet protein mabinlin-2 n=2 Tax=Capparis masaikai TaxID=13395 RepID=2SS2_CAPMA|nr:RecName: Full=Sweet protein mabinlin-2; AltName: Full=Mabinlin II; Short=MAB II; Contains: RecName: Full=Sweet protein mabinlin-2 chain A; Contains: RecName: Full=Sweet protein mabinlin-2 chain B; Flags: Precursor [Capparis masaikai]
MAKLIFLFATLALFVLLANASIQTTVIEVDEEEDNQLWRCQRQFLQHQRLRACQRFIHRRAQFGGQPDELEDEVEDDNDDENQPRRPALRQCCNQLRQVDRPCVCPVLRQAAQQVLQRQIIQGPQQLRRLFDAARNLPNICNIPNIGACPFRAWP